MRFKIIAEIILLAILLIVWGYFSNPGRYSARLQTTGLNSHFDTKSNVSFQQYVTATQSMLKQARIKGRVNATDSVVAANAPAILLPDSSCPVGTDGKYAKGILLIHGLLDSGYAMQQLGKFFQRQCFVVYVLLLPGHGTVPGDLLHTTYHDWMNAAAFGATKLAENADELYLGGHSLGGLLAIHTALQNPTKYKALFLFAPALKINSKLTPLTAPVYWLSYIVERLQWWSVYPDNEITRYESFTINSVYQTAKLMRRVHRKLAKQPLNIPIFVEQSAEDATIDAEKTLSFFDNNHQPKSRLFWFFEKGFYSIQTDPRIQVINSTLPDQNVLSLSHLSLTLAEDDPIYGRNGEYKDCLQYDITSSSWLKCKSGENTFLGEVTDYNLKLHLIQRITFNPFYTYMLGRMEEFIHAL